MNNFRSTKRIEPLDALQKTSFLTFLSFSCQVDRYFYQTRNSTAVFPTFFGHLFNKFTAKWWLKPKILRLFFQLFWGNFSLHSLTPWARLTPLTHRMCWRRPNFLFFVIFSPGRLIFHQTRNSTTRFWSVQRPKIVRKHQKNMHICSNASCHLKLNLVWKLAKNCLFSYSGPPFLETLILV